MVAFLASPGDLAPERNEARRVVEAVNKSIRDTDWQIELLGWEDTLAGAGRPQELINRDLDRCDLFIGLLGRRWGQSTGRASSGFEEEFERARQRWSTAGVPDLWIFFRQIDPESASDPGPQLARVIEFRTSLHASRSLLSKEFRDVADFGEQLRQDLTRHLLARVLDDHGLTLRRLTEDQSFTASPSTAETIKAFVGGLDAASRTGAPVDASSMLELARAFMARGEWGAAADYLDVYVRSAPDAFEVQVARAISHSNARGGRMRDLSALRAYNEALALAPDSLSPALLARYLSYRGAILKRLGRLEEAENDLMLALRHAGNAREADDAHYNLAGVYALQDRRKDMLLQVGMITSARFLESVRFHLRDYFAAFATDPDLLALLGEPRQRRKR